MEVGSSLSIVRSIDWRPVERLSNVDDCEWAEFWQ
jgi:hypothetical protein